MIRLGCTSAGVAAAPRARARRLEMPGPVPNRGLNGAAFHPARCVKPEADESEVDMRMETREVKVTSQYPPHVQ